MYLSLLDLMRQRSGWLLPDLPVLTAPNWAEEGADLLLRLPLPGLDPQSVELQVTESMLTVTGHRTHEERVEGQDFYRASASYGAVTRSFRLPVRVIPRETRVIWQAGDLLEIRLRKA